MHHSYFHCRQLFFRQVYGADIVHGLAATAFTNHTELFGTQEFEAALKTRNIDGHAIFINGFWPHYTTLIPWLASLECICVIVAPIWEQHSWFDQVLQHSTHIWTLPPDACFPLQGIE